MTATAQLDIFGEPVEPPREAAPEPVIRELIGLGCDPDLARGYSRKQAHAVLRKLKEKVARKKAATDPVRPPARAGTTAEWDEPPSPALACDPDGGEGQHAEPMRWHLFPVDRPTREVVVEFLNDTRKLPPEVILPRCVFWAIRHLSPGAVVRLIDWLREELSRGQDPGRATTPGVAGTGGTVAAGGDERLAGGGGRWRDAPPHIADAPRPTAGDPAAGLARHAEDEADREPEPVDLPDDGW